MSHIKHHGFLSSIKYDNLTPWYTTIEDNEIIEFKESNGQQRHFNSLLIESEAVELYVRILPGDYCLYIPPYDLKNYEFEEITSIQIMNNTGTKLRWSGLFY